MTTLRILIIVIAFVGAGFLLCPRNPSAEQVDPQVLLENVIKAERSVPYTADQIYEAAYLGKSHRKRVHVVQPGSGRAMLDRRYYDLIKANYVPLVEGEDKVDGREVWTLRLMPNRDKYPWRKSAPWKQLWVDKKTSVVLASREWTSTNTIKRSMRTESIMYTKLQAPPVQLSKIVDAGEGHPLEKLEKDIRCAPQIKSFKPRYLPGGFRLVSAYCAGKSEYRLTYSDGLYCINITGTINPGIREKSAATLKDSGQCLIYSRSFNGHSIIVTADLPLDEFNKLNDSIN